MKKIAFALILALLPVAASAHGEGATYETQIGSYYIDIGYSAPEPITGESVLFDFTLPAEHQYTDVWVRIENETGATVFATGVYNASFGGPRLTYTFPREGAYTIHARYENGSETLVEASFPITVAPPTQTTDPAAIDNVLFMLSGIAVGLLAAVLLGRVKWR